MALTRSICEEHIRHTLGSSSSIPGSANALINQAGEYLAGCHPWKWLVRPPVALDLRGTITVSGASWNNGTLTLTAAGAFTNYTWKAGDQIVITAGTSTTLGTYNVASRVSDNAITLTASIGATASSVSGTMDFPWIVLPTDFGECLRLQGTTTAAGIEQVTYQEVLDRRAVGLSGEAHSYRGAFVWRRPFADLTPPESAPVPRLELDRGPASNSTAAFQMVYRAGWPITLDDSAFAQVPVFMELLFLQILRATARGFEEEDEGSLDKRMAEIKLGPVFMAAQRRDAMIQRSYGRIQPGDIGRPQHNTWGEGDGWISSQVAPPSTF